MSWILDALTTQYNALDDGLNTIGVLEEDHLTDWRGRAWTTPSIIDHDDGKETNGEAQR